MHDVDTAGLAVATQPKGYLAAPRAAMRNFFYMADVPEEIIELDNAAATLTPASLACDALVPGIVAEQAHAHAVTTPVMLVYSEIDVSPEPLREATYYASAQDGTVITLPKYCAYSQFCARPLCVVASH